MTNIQKCLSDLATSTSSEKALSHFWQMFLMAENIFDGYEHGVSLSKSFACSAFKSKAEI